MAKVKVHELAKELNIQSKEILQYLSEQNIEVKSHMSSIEDDVIRVVKKKFAKSEPVSGCATITISAETAGMSESMETLMNRLVAADGVIRAEILAG